MPLHLDSLHQPEPDWRSWTQLQRSRIPAGIQPWLRDDGSLTRRVIRNCPGRFRVRVLRQGWGRPWAGERRRLGMDGAGVALIREVELLCGEWPWVFARTLIPASTLHGAARRLAYLRDRPLGALLFAEPGVRRERMEMARLLPRHALYRTACAGIQAPPPDLWGRRTLFYMEDRPLLVHEIFLPDCPQ